MSRSPPSFVAGKQSRARGGSWGDATTRNAALAALENIVGARHLMTDPALFAGALVEPRGLYRGNALALIRPGTTAEVAAVAAFCNDARIAIVPQGGNTGLVGGQTPDSSGDQIILSLRAEAIREVDPHADVMICEAGVTLAEAQAAALPPTGFSRCRLRPRGPARSAATSRPTPAARR